MGGYILADLILANYGEARGLLMIAILFLCIALLPSLMENASNLGGWVVLLFVIDFGIAVIGYEDEEVWGIISLLANI